MSKFDTLFPAGDPTEMDIKFFPGRKSQVSPEQLRDQLLRADAQVRQGVAVADEDLDGNLPFSED
ncbi:MAG: hypothetical protein SGJ23_13430 [Alphaproteobacteria bacterium]|nr:hypothetical protein [Alphaproteobacteria bacterium]